MTNNVEAFVPAVWTNNQSLSILYAKSKRGSIHASPQASKIRNHLKPANHLRHS